MVPLGVRAELEQVVFAPRFLEPTGFLLAPVAGNEYPPLVLQFAFDLVALERSDKTVSHSEESLSAEHRQIV